MQKLSWGLGLTLTSGFDRCGFRSSDGGLKRQPGSLSHTHTRTQMKCVCVASYFRHFESRLVCRSRPLRANQTTPPPKRERDVMLMLMEKPASHPGNQTVSLPYESVLKVDTIIYSFCFSYFFCRGDTFTHLGVLLFKVPYVLTCYGW